MNSHIITIGRQFGSGGHEVGLRLAKRLGIPFYDKEILTMTAENSKFSESYLEKMDEQKPSFLGMGASSMMAGSSLSVAGSAMASSFYHMSPNDQVFLEQTKVLHKLAQNGPCVIVGRGSDYVLKDMEPVNIFIYADLKDRVNRKLMLEGKDSSEAKNMEKLIAATDKNRSKYYEYYTHARWGEAKNYHLCIDTSATGVDGAVDTIIAFLEAFSKKSLMPDK